MTTRSAPAAKFRARSRTKNEAALIAASNQSGAAVLTYSITPNAVPVGSLQTFTFTATNNSGAPVTIQAITDSITLGNLNQLTNSPVSPQGVAYPWQATPNGATLEFWALAAVTLNDSEGVSFNFVATMINTPGTATLSVTEVIGGNSADAPALPVLLQDALSITAFANPCTVGQQRAVVLQWNTIGGQYVTISPGTDQQYPAGTANTLVTPSQNAPNTVYTLTVHQDDQTADYQVTVTLGTPVIKSFQIKPSHGLRIKDFVQASWSTQYATQVTMSPPLDESPFVQASDARSFDPSADLPANAMSEPYTITLYGYQGPVQQTLTVDYLPMRILYLRYSTFPTQQNPNPPVIYDVFNAQPGTSLNLTGNPIQLTAVGPGGPAYAQLGGTGPEVQVMLADPSPVPSGQSTTISYLVKNATSLTLQPGNQPLSFDSNGNGSVSVQPQQSTTYVLLASNGGVTVTSELGVSVS
ncbi:hypothetical protein [Silvibacterium acidisoli]|uniref:hypothetical protein n=1 Tax=Acidobacteriaceae bacterium ZG23-2 TaxID=2883246 RepID=UPI00406C2EC9